MAVFSSLALAGVVSLAPCHADDDEVRPELGRVEWSRDLEASLAASKLSGKPVLVLFQEVPG